MRAAVLLLPSILVAAECDPGRAPGTRQEGELVVRLPVAAAAPWTRAVPGDEIDALERAVAPPARFAAHAPAFTVELRRFTFAHAGGRQEVVQWQVVRDGARVVALLRSGDLQLLAATPERAPTAIALPTERYHLDNLLGPSLTTHQGVGRVWTHGAIYDQAAGAGDAQEAWEGDGRSLTLVRRRATDAQRIEHRFTLTCDPVYGYRVDADYAIAMAAAPDAKTVFVSGTFSPGNYVPWADAAIYARTVFTPADAPVWRGWGNNLIAMDRCDEDRARFAWRDDGFIAYLVPGGDGWNPVRTRRDGFGAPSMRVCNAHDDFHISLRYPAVEPDAEGWRRWRLHHRLMWLPPEMGRRVWDGMEVILRGQRGLVIALGATEDFEAQPKPLDEPQRGLVWTANAPPLRDGAGRDGSRALEIRGRQWPNLPQVSLRPGVTYRIEGWYRVRPYTPAELAEAQAADARERERLARAGKPPPPAIDWEALRPRAWIEADQYEWSPYASPMLVRERTSEAVAGDWQRVALDVVAPDWGPFLNIAFVCADGVALLDDLRIAPVAP